MEDEFIVFNRQGRVGRPSGHRLSDRTKEKIRQKRLGCCHTQETKDKISRSLTEYFKSRDSLSASIENEYIDVSDEAVEWICEHREELDMTDHVMTEKRLMYLKHLEICIGSDIEYLFGHNATPEFLILLKEELEENGSDADINELRSLI